MKHYNIENYVRYKKDLNQSMPEEKPWKEYTRDELIIRFSPMQKKLQEVFRPLIERQV
jgi:hypothetical protein